jgi:hypothetical protein
MAKIINAKYPGTCKGCGGRFGAGTKIVWESGAGAKHVECPSEPEKAHSSLHKTVTAPRSAEGPIKLSGGSGYGCEGWYVGQVIVSSEKRRREGGPDGLVVVTASKRYVREDGMSFGVGDEQGHLYSASARPATQEELQTRVDDICEQAYIDKARAELKDEFEAIKAKGERPERCAWPHGETLYDTATGYGHGQAIVIGDDEISKGIWAIQHNGADGDDWSHNNLPGCIGWRIDRNEELANRIRGIVVAAKLKR